MCLPRPLSVDTFHYLCCGALFGEFFFFLILHLLILNQESGMHCKVVGLIADDWAVTQAAVLWGVVSMVHLTFYASRWISWLCALKIEYNILKGVNHPDITCQY